MKKAYVIIGAGYGDEGKGLITDYYAAQSGEDCLVVRFNGGAQAAHTVVTPEGVRHVFSHFGSGSFVGSRTYLSKFFIINPVQYRKEFGVLIQKTSLPGTYADPDCLITTPWDMMANQIIEEHRTKRHGSCGIGINETVERNTHDEFGLTVSSAALLGRDELIRFLKSIRDNYYHARLGRFGIHAVPERYAFFDDGVIERFLDDMRYFSDTTICSGASILGRADTVIFEGAQGLMLDQNHPNFPHVTRSNTGLTNVAELIKDTPAIRDIDVVYATRVYATRHGAGPLPNEVAGLPYPRIEDRTNIPNTWQGTLRFGWLDLDVLKSVVFKDRTLMPFATSSIALTCLDQIDGNVKFFENKNEINFRAEKFAEYLSSAILPVSLVSSGPTRSHVEEVADHAKL